MSLPALTSDFDVIRRFPVLRGARSAASTTSAAAAPMASQSSQSHTDHHSLQESMQQYHSASLSVVASRGDPSDERPHTPARHSFEGIPPQLVYGLFEAKKNERYVVPPSWSPTNPRQVTDSMCNTCPVS